MSDSGERRNEWRRSLAIEAFNGAWELIDQSSRTPDEDREMLVRSAAARYLWDAVGGDEQRAIGDWQIAHVLSWLGEGTLALRFAEAALRVVDTNGWGDWRLASCLEGVARAHAVAGDTQARDRYVARCSEVLKSIESPEERDLIASQLATVPGLQNPPGRDASVPDASDERGREPGD
jgi:hypothetical protein